MPSDLASPSPRLHSCYSCHHSHKTCARVLPPGYAHYSRLCPLLPLLTVIVRAAETLPKRVNRDAPGPCKSLVLSACAYLRSSGRVACIYSCSDALACDLRLVCLRISTLIIWKRPGIKSGGLHALSGRPYAHVSLEERRYPLVSLALPVPLALPTHTPRVTRTKAAFLLTYPRLRVTLPLHALRGALWPFTACHGLVAITLSLVLVHVTVI